MALSTNSSSPSRRFLLAALVIGGLILYSSLLPFSYNGLSLTAGWQEFLHMPWLGNVAGGRTDWIANILLYLPAAFAVAGWLSGDNLYRRPNWLAYAPILLVSAAVAFGIEVLQVFFVSRAVALDDVLAAVIGSLLGVLLWHRSRIWLVAVWHDLGSGGTTAIRAAGLLYGFAYLLLALFPYDFALSLTELDAKSAADQVGWLIAPASCPTALRCILKLLLEILAAFPLGVILGLSSLRNRVGYRVAPLLGLALGATLEIAHFFILSGTSQGLSVLTRAAAVRVRDDAFVALHIGSIDFRHHERRVRVLAEVGRVIHHHSARFHRMRGKITGNAAASAEERDVDALERVRSKLLDGDVLAFELQLLPGEIGRASCRERVS
jgi:VanZ family protein